MTATSQPVEHGDVPVAVAPSGFFTVRTAALSLWAVVGTLLVYGVSQTVIKAAALFG